MPRFRPFRATLYTPDAGDLSNLLAPPYDVIGAEQARELRARSPFNAVRLVLPEGGVPGCYELAARRLADWRRDGILARDRDSALFVYAQTFRHRGRVATRHGVFGALRLSEFGEGHVLPHEETHAGPKEDRLALMRACGAQLSPVFLVAPDPAEKLSALVDRATRGAPTREGTTPDGVRHRLWRVGEGPLAEELRAATGDRPLLIADGHHRYETALELARGRPEDHPARWTLACVVARGDPGLLCLPTHRALAHPPRGRGWTELLEEGFRLESLPPGTSPDEAAGAAAEAGAGAMAALLPGGRGVLLEPLPEIKPRRGADARPQADTRTEDDAATEGAARTEADAHPAPVHFDRRVLRRGFDLGPDPAVERGLLSYHRDAGEAAAAVGLGSGVRGRGARRGGGKTAPQGSGGTGTAGQAAGGEGAAFLLPPPDVGAVWEAARRGVRLPPKSTYFWPKLPSGVVLRELAPR